MAIPLVARDNTLGALVFVSTDPDRLYAAADLEIGQSLASRAALAAESAMLLEKERDALHTRDEVLAIVSHDLRDPLNTIGMSAQLLMDVSVEDTDRQKHLLVISRAKDRMNRLIQDLVDVARMKGGKSLSIEIRPEQLGPVIHETCEAFAESTHEKAVAFECQVPDGIPDVMIDRRRILQVLSNLLGNALKFTPDGGRIQLRAEGIAENKVQVSVRDSGPGIPPENLKRIFEAFWQAPRAKRLGSGLGLAISRGIVQLHGGRIWAESREGEGSTLFFTIPIANSKEH
jgi:signal transduction histidine kinase